MKCDICGKTIFNCCEFTPKIKYTNGHEWEIVPRGIQIEVEKEYKVCTDCFLKIFAKGGKLNETDL